MPQNLINGFSQTFPLLMLSSFFGASVAGQYSLVISVLAAPTLLIGNSVSSVFYPKINESIQTGGNSRALIIKATMGLAVIGFLPFTVIMMFGPIIFEFIFGAEWGVSGQYAQWLAPWVFFQFVNKPAVAAIPSLNLQKGLLIYEVFSTGSKVIALLIGFLVFKSDIVAIGLFSSFGVLAYLYLILWVIKNSKQGQLNDG